MAGVKMGREAKEIALNIRREKLIEQINQFVSQGNQLYDWRTQFRNQVWHLKYEYEELTGEEISLPSFFADYLGFDAKDIEIPEDVMQERKKQKSTKSSGKKEKTQYDSEKARLKEESRLEKKTQKLKTDINNFVKDGNDIADWRTKFKDRVRRLKDKYEKHLGEEMTTEDFFVKILSFENASEIAPSNDTKLEKRRQNVINTLTEYVKQNGSIYGWKKTGIVGVVRDLQQIYQRKEGAPISITDFFSRYLGFEYDANYAIYLDKMLELSKFADENNCINDIRNKPNGTTENTLYVFLNARAHAIGCSVFDYVLLTTPYHFSNGAIPGNYVDYVKMLAEDASQDDNTIDFSQNGKIYRKVHHLSKNSLNEHLSTEDILEQVLMVRAEGFNPRDNGPRVDSIDEEKLVEALKAFAGESGDVAGITEKDPKLYGQLKSITRGETPLMFLERHGLTNSNSAENAKPRFSSIETTYEARAAELFPIRDQIIAEGQAVGKYNFDEMTDMQTYYARLEIAQKTIKTYYGKLGLARYSNGFFPQPSDDGEDAETQEANTQTDEEIAGLELQGQTLNEGFDIPTDERSGMKIGDGESKTIEHSQKGETLAQEFLQRKFGESDASKGAVLEDTEGKID